MPSAFHIDCPGTELRTSAGRNDSDGGSPVVYTVYTRSVTIMGCFTQLIFIVNIGCISVLRLISTSHVQYVYQVICIVNVSQACLLVCIVISTTFAFHGG